MERNNVATRKGSAQDYRRRQDGPKDHETGQGQDRGSESHKDRNQGRGTGKTHNWGNSELSQHLKTKKKQKDSAQEAPILFGKLQVPAVYIEQSTNSVRVPQFQPFQVSPNFNENLTNDLVEIQKILFSEASQGRLLLLEESFMSLLQERVQSQNATKLVSIAEQEGIIQRTVRKFSHIKTLYFISLNLAVISYESLQWALTSLKIDEMTPSEKAIQSRIKEAFAYKILPQVWTEVTKTITLGAQAKLIYLKLSSEEKTMIYSQQLKFKFHKSDLDCNFNGFSHSKMFYKAEIEQDPVMNLKVYALYFQDKPRWEGVDSVSSTFEVPPKLYRAFNEFIFKYFQKSEEGDESNQWCSSISNALTKEKSGNRQEVINDLHLKAIPGGRYGCAQFIKICGPKSLRELSLGRIAQMVQQAVRDNLLKYHKTLLIWTDQVKNIHDLENPTKAANPKNSSQDRLKYHKTLLIWTDQVKNIQDLENPTKAANPKNSSQDRLKNHKLTEIKQALISILKEFPQGISLAQLPQQLKRQLKYEIKLEQLGFQKFKDLLLSMNDEIKVELKGINHPFAYYVEKSSPPLIASPGKKSEISEDLSDNLQALNIRTPKGKSEEQKTPSDPFTQSVFSPLDSKPFFPTTKQPEPFVPQEDPPYMMTNPYPQMGNQIPMNLQLQNDPNYQQHMMLLQGQNQMMVTQPVFHNQFYNYSDGSSQQLSVQGYPMQQPNIPLPTKQYQPQPQPVMPSMSMRELIPKQQCSQDNDSLAKQQKFQGSQERPRSSDNLIDPQTMNKSSMFMLSPEAMIEEMLNDDSPNITAHSFINKTFPKNPKLNEEGPPK